VDETGKDEVLWNRDSITESLWMLLGRGARRGGGGWTASEWGRGQGRASGHGEKGVENSVSDKRNLMRTTMSSAHRKVRFG